MSWKSERKKKGERERDRGRNCRKVKDKIPELNCSFQKSGDWRISNEVLGEMIKYIT